jgi:hypothetical protein
MIHTWRSQRGSQPQDQVVVLLVLGGINPCFHDVRILGWDLVSEELGKKVHVQVLRVVSGVHRLKLMWEYHNVLALLGGSLSIDSD